MQVAYTENQVNVGSRIRSGQQISLSAVGLRYRLPAPSPSVFQRALMIFDSVLRYIAVRVRGRYRSASRQSKRCQRVMTVWQGHGPPRNLRHQSAHGRMFTEACSAGVFV